MTDTLVAQHAREVEQGERFEFGRNWASYLKQITPARIQKAEESLKQMLEVETLAGRRFLDVGCGSGLFSLAAWRLGAGVHSFDFDPDSVACARALRQQHGGEQRWQIEQGSVLDARYLWSLGAFDVVYAWGVLHHTGEMWQALANAAIPVAPGGQLFIAIYNDCGAESRKWHGIKKRYGTVPSRLKSPYAALAIAPYEFKEAARSLLRLQPMDYLRSWTHYSGRRGMSRWHDIVDWVGGFPYEYASVNAVCRFYEKHGFKAARVEGTRGLGCNEFVFSRST